MRIILDSEECVGTRVNDQSQHLPGLRRFPLPIETFAAFIEERKLGVDRITFVVRSDRHFQETARLTILGVLVRDLGFGICRSTLTWRNRPESIGITNGPA